MSIEFDLHGVMVENTSQQMHKDLSDSDALSELLVLLAQNLVFNPRDLIVDVEDKGPSGFFCLIRSDVTDKSILIGKAGRNANAMREILSSSIYCKGRPIRLSVGDPVGGIRMDPTPFETDRDWTPAKESAMAALFESIVKHCSPDSTVQSREIEYGKSYVRILDSQDMSPSLKISLSDIFKSMGKFRGREVDIEFQD